MNIAAALSTREKCSLEYPKEFHNIKYTNKISDQILKNIIHFNPNSSPNDSTKDQTKPELDNESIQSMMTTLQSTLNKTTLSILRSNPADLDHQFQVHLNQMQASLMLLNEFYADHSKKIQTDPLNNIKSLKEDLGADIDILQDTYEKTNHKATKDIRLLYKFYLDQTLHHSKAKPKIKHTVPPESQNIAPPTEPEHQNKKTLPLHTKNMNLTKTIKSHSGMKSALVGQENNSNSHSISHQMRHMGPHHQQHHSEVNLKDKSAAAKKLVTRLDFQKVTHNDQKNNKENQMPNTQAHGSHRTFQKDEPYLTTKRKSHHQHHKSMLPRRKSADYLIPQSFTNHLKATLHTNHGGDQSSRETLTTAQTNSSNMFNASIHNDHKNVNLKKRLMSFGAHDFKQILEKHETFPKRKTMAVTCLSARTTEKEIKAIKPVREEIREEVGENKQRIFTKIFEKNMLINNLKQDIKNSLQNFSDAYKKAKTSKFDPKPQPLQKIDEEPKQIDHIIFGINLDQAAVLEKDSQDETEMIAQAEDIMTEILMNIEADTSNKEISIQNPLPEKGLLSKLEDEHVLNKNDIETLKNLKEMDKLISHSNQLPIEGANPTATFQALQKKVEKDGKFKNTKYFVPAIPQRKIQIKEVENQNKEEEEKHKKELEAYFTNRDLISDFENMLEKSNSLVIQGNKIPEHNEDHLDEDEFLKDLIKNKQEHNLDGDHNLSFNLDGGDFL